MRWSDVANDVRRGLGRSYPEFERLFRNIHDIEDLRYTNTQAHTNLMGSDDDINTGGLARLSPSQTWHSFHRLQRFYVWALYGLLIVNWHLFYDFKNLARGSIASNHFSRPRGWDLAQFIGGKVLFLTWAVLIPLLFHAWQHVLLGYLGTVIVVGVVLGTVFQLAHCVEEARFPAPLSGTQRMEESWALHQIRTTVDFAPSNRLLSWYVGGLNFQIEHHLFPHICHVHYPRVAQIVRDVCVERGISYGCNGTLFGALASHWRWMHRMGQQRHR